MKTWALLLCIAIALSGCTGNSDTDNPSESGNGESELEAPSGETPGGESPSGNETIVNETILPNATLSAWIPGLAPVQVQFNFTISGFENPDGVDWSLDVDSDGTLEVEEFGGLPGTYNFTFNVGGNYTATFVAYDSDFTVEVTVELIIEEEFVAPPRQTNDYAGSTSASSGPQTTEASLCLSQFIANFDCALVEIPDDLAGIPFAASSSGSSTYVEFLSDCADWSSGLGTITSKVGIVPSGATCVAMWVFGATPAGSTFTITI